MSVGNGHWTDLIDDFMSYTSTVISPEPMRLWAAIGMIGGACERRVWTKLGDNFNWANLYIMLVGDPGTGKGIIRVVKDLWLSTMRQSNSTGNAFNIASSSVTHASLVDELNEAESDHQPKIGPVYITHPLLIGAEEFEAFLPSYDRQFISYMNDFWNNDTFFTASRRHGPVKKVEIKFPLIHMLAGIQPAYFAHHFPEEAWSTGLARRSIMVFSTRPANESLLRVTPNRDAMRENILRRLSLLRDMYGQIIWTKEAADAINGWYLDDCPPKPRHPKLAVGYNSTRHQFVIKLALISVVARTGIWEHGEEPVIEPYDLRRAFVWLMEAEKVMPDIFMSMAGKSDYHLQFELQEYVLKKWTINGHQGIATDELVRFLAVRVPAEKIMKLIEMSEKGSMLARSSSNVNLWLPGPNIPPELMHGA